MVRILSFTAPAEALLFFSYSDNINKIEVAYNNLYKRIANEKKKMEESIDELKKVIIKLNEKISKNHINLIILSVIVHIALPF